MVLITGASKGIGAALAEVCAQKGHDVLLVARSASLLQEKAQDLQQKYGVHVYEYAVDLCDVTEIEKLYTYTQQQGWDIDILINNAGVGACDAFADIAIERHHMQIQLNITALTLLTHRFLAGMIAKDKGKILNIASTAAFQPGPYMSVYFASKAYVLSFSQALRYELRNRNISVTTHCPGPTESAFAAEAGNDKTMLFKQGAVASAQEVAEDAYRAMMKGKGVAVHGWTNKLGALLAPYVPYWITNRAAAYLNTP